MPLIIEDGRAQRKESVTNRLLADRVEIWGIVVAGTLLLDRDSVLQGMDLLHVFLVFADWPESGLLANRNGYPFLFGSSA